MSPVRWTHRAGNRDGRRGGWGVEVYLTAEVLDTLAVVHQARDALAAGWLRVDGPEVCVHPEAPAELVELLRANRALVVAALTAAPAPTGPSWSPPSPLHPRRPAPPAPTGPTRTPGPDTCPRCAAPEATLARRSDGLLACAACWHDPPLGPPPPPPGPTLLGPRPSWPHASWACQSCDASYTAHRLGTPTCCGLPMLRPGEQPDQQSHDERT